MSISLKKSCFYIWNTNYERKNIQNEFKPLQIRYIGVEKTSEYNDILKTYYEKFNENKELCVLFDNEIPMVADFELINYVNKELQTMDVNFISKQDIVLFDQADINTLFLNSLEYVVRLAIKKENFFNESTRNNFIVKLILWAYTYLRPLRYNNNKTNKCFYYGTISKHEIYFLLMLSKMNFDVIYVNPLKEELWDSIDEDSLFEKVSYQYIIQIETLNKKIKDANVLQQQNTITLEFAQQMDEQLFQNTGVFRPWQFRGANTVPIFLNSTIEDLKNNWHEQSRLRQGFTTKENKVYIPNLFHQIDGVYKNFSEYKKLVNDCIQDPNNLTLVIHGNEVNYIPNIPNEDKYQLTFCQLNDGSYNIDEIKKLDFYPLKKYKLEIQDFILTKINECILDKDFLSNPLKGDQILDFIMQILFLSTELIKLIDNFDFVEHIPKVVIFLENQTELNEKFMPILAFLNKIPFDIVIFNPSGLFDIRNYLNSSIINTIRLEQTKYDVTYQNIKEQDSIKGFFKNIFSKIN